MGVPVLCAKCLVLHMHGSISRRCLVGIPLLNILAQLTVPHSLAKKSSGNPTLTACHGLEQDFLEICMTPRSTFTRPERTKGQLVEKRPKHARTAKRRCLEDEFVLSRDRQTEHNIRGIFLRAPDILDPL